MSYLHIERAAEKSTVLFLCPFSVKSTEGLADRLISTKRDIELFARNNYVGWDNWGLEIPDSKIEISTGLVNKNEEESGQLKLDV